MVHNCWKLKGNDRTITLTEVSPRIGGVRNKRQLSEHPVAHFRNNSQFPVQFLAMQTVQKPRAAHSLSAFGGVCLWVAVRARGRVPSPPAAAADNAAAGVVYPRLFLCRNRPPPASPSRSRINRIKVELAALMGGALQSLAPRAQRTFFFRYLKLLSASISPIPAAR
ncbi:unnamed protein product, partial [Iphiclides podalirius]